MIRLVFTLLSGGLVTVLDALADAINWLFADLHRIPLAILGLASFMLALFSWSLVQERDDARRAVADATALRVQEHADLAAASVAAELRAVRNVERVRTEYAAQLERVSHDHQNLLARHRLTLADFMRRNRATPTDSRSTSAAGLSANAALPTGPVHPAAASDISDPSVLVSSGDLERCAAAFAGYASLIVAWQALADISTSAPSSAESPGEVSGEAP